MTKVTVSGAALDAFTGFLAESGPVEVCDPEGNVLGRFESAVQVAYELKSPLSEAEVRGSAAAAGGLPLDEVWKRIKAPTP